jgi:hypothetical protein
MPIFEPVTFPGVNSRFRYAFSGQNKCDLHGFAYSFSSVGPLPRWL